ncbi:hypothetical protein BV22DRAFT_1133939 [Leucogyrophana mollusca]|uniref:Uncharacterized protein n=1 Tax=Leucogyrophana mollusca TaxID=85980 RepID=A0ACB8B285_9AGAM|nr:hypothetical protein BV22DRAFT_1133939 [Leucogyrophana mollusca]
MAPHAITDEEYESLYGPDPNTREYPDESDDAEGGVWSGNEDRLAGVCDEDPLPPTLVLALQSMQISTDRYKAPGDTEQDELRQELRVEIARLQRLVASILAASKRGGRILPKFHLSAHHLRDSIDALRSVEHLSVHGTNKARSSSFILDVAPHLPYRVLENTRLGTKATFLPT